MSDALPAAQPRYQVSEVEEGIEDGLLHYKGNLKEFGDEIEAFLLRRIRETNGVDETDTRSVCLGCAVTGLHNATVNMGTEITKAADPETTIKASQMFTLDAKSIQGMAVEIGFRGAILKAIGLAKVARRG